MNQPAKTLGVICPVYNEQDVIEHFHSELSSVLSKLAPRYKATTLFVVDRCSDNTLELLRKISKNDPNVQVLALSSRFGHQMSLIAGIDHLDTDVLVMLDSDLQHPPSLIPKLLEEFEKGFDVVSTIRDEAEDTSVFKKTTSSLFYKFLNQLSDVEIKESAADFRLISRKVANVFRTQIREQNQFLRGLFGWVGFKNTSVSYRAQPRHSGRSKYSLGRLMRFGTSGIVSFSKKPLQAAVYVGVAFACLGFVWALSILIDYYRLNNLPPGWTTLAILVSVFSGIQLIFMGIFGEYLGAIFDEVKRRPHYIVDEKINFDREHA